LTSYEVIVPASIGTGVAKTSLGTIYKPSQAQNLIEVIPYQSQSGAYTAGQSILTEIAVESKSLSSILPKRFVMPPIAGGLGTTTGTCIPILEAYECNTLMPDSANSDITVYGQAQVANTVAPVVGCALHYGLSPPSEKEMYYDKPDNETNTGTTATTVAGGSITINGGKTLQKLFPHVAPAVVTTSEDYLASMQFNSSSFGNSMPLEVPCQPIASALGALVNIAMPKGAIYKNVNMPMKDTCVINTVLRLSEALTATGNFIGIVGYTK